MYCVVAGLHFVVFILSFVACVDGYANFNAILQFPRLNKGSSFTNKEKMQHRLLGMYPSGDAIPLCVKVANAMDQLQHKSTNLEKYIYLQSIQNADETLFFALLTQHTETLLPLVYTPTVGDACLQWDKIDAQQPRGLYISFTDKGRIADLLSNRGDEDIRAIVLTDGERILGLGDLGVNGMGIPIGKLALYTACGGLHPHQCLPVHIDVGTNNEKLLSSPTYAGLRHRRVVGREYDELIDEFISAAQQRFGKHVLFQFEDFGNHNAFRLLHRHCEKSNCFNDDIQGTAAVVVAGLLSAVKLTPDKPKLSDHTFLFHGAGSAGIGIADLLAAAIAMQSNTTLSQARSKIWFVDSMGLITSSRMGLSASKQPYAHRVTRVAPGTSPLMSAIHTVKPSALIGVSAQSGAFTREVVETMTSLTSSPIIFALSNPTSKAECTAQNAYSWSHGKCIFASGSPFDAVTIGSRRFIPGQGNNAFIFPGVALAAVACKSTRIIDRDFLTAAGVLASMVSDKDLKNGTVYPSLRNIKEVSLSIATAVAKDMYASGRTDSPEPKYVRDYLSKYMYSPRYIPVHKTDQS